MHYGKFAFSKNGQQTLKAIGSDRALGSSTTLGASDLVAINALYDCASKDKSIWSTWSSYGPCDSRCFRTRQRFCSHPDLNECPTANSYGVAEEQVTCSDAECNAPVDGHWGRWSSWSACNAECGPGKRSRTRVCDNPLPKNGGKVCAGESKSFTDCNVKRCGMGPLDCEFDGQGWCFWQNDPTNPSTFQWKRISGRTPSGNTGPTSDHTSGTGSYLFVETSSPAATGDKARIISKEMPATEGLCMSFWYHMYGVTMGSLRIFTQSTNGVKSMIWEQSGDLGNQWLKGDMKITSQTPFKVIFEAEKGSAFLSDIGLDDIFFKDCAPKSHKEVVLHWAQRQPKKSSRDDARKSSNVERNDKIVDFGCSFIAYFDLHLVFLCTARGKQGDCVLHSTVVYLAHRKLIRIDVKSTSIEQDGKGEEAENVYDQIIKVNENSKSKLFEGDIVYDRTVDAATGVDERIAEEPAGDYAKDAVRDRAYLWTTRIVPFEFTSVYTNQQREVVYSAMRTIENASCIIFKNHTNEDNWLKFNKQGGCSSPVGRTYFRKGAQSLSLADGCYSRMIVVHELLHALGFWHEQSRPDRDRYIEIFWENIPDKFAYNFDKYSHQEADTLNLPYDYKTIMHYGKYQGSLYTGKPTMLAIGKKDLKLGGSQELTPTDIIQLNRLYNCKSASNKQVMSDWTDFGPCDGSCHKKRQKFCTHSDQSKCPNVDKNGIITEIVKCSNAECYAPVDGHWGRWGYWGPCLPECGQRKQVRKRYCTNPVPKNGGKPCDVGISEESSACSPKSCSLKCNFDADEWCGWRNSYSNIYRFQWKRQNYQTPSKTTGPDFDHTTGKASGNGYFIFTEASHPAERGDKAGLFSKMVNATGNSCLSFWYHMQGPKMGSLRVFVKTKDGVKTLVWNKTGDHGNKWLLADVEIGTRGLYQVIFEAERGEDFASDFGLDDINFQKGKCQGLLERLCGFPMKKIGCYQDAYPNRALPDLLVSNRHLISWKKYDESLVKVLCDCAKRTKNKGNTYFGLQYYSECWSGPGNIPFGIYGTCNRCLNGKFETCSDKDEKPCAGRGFTNYVYKLS
eukprot:Seg3210.1 transcript_id=Seg3210.1/GoldUCD/mRNA.D3Y31 product="Zinc metalloproteinase nas-6" protein_id=Seg3210.1/GoldUCD/D3Y31